MYEGTSTGVDVETTSNSTLEPEDDVAALRDNQRTKRLFEHLVVRKPVHVASRLPSLDEARAVLAADFKDCDEVWAITAPKKAVSRYRRYI